MSEELGNWMPIEGFPGYEVSDAGHVRSLDRVSRGARLKGRMMKPDVRARGYHAVVLRRDGKRFPRYIHRLVCSMFNGPTTGDKTQVAHYDGNPGNNCAANLRWATAAENCADRVRHGSDARGERNGKSVLTVEQVIEIRQRYVDGETQVALAAEFGVYHTAVHKIVHRLSWACI